MNNGPQKFSGWSSLLSEFARLVLTVVGPKRLAKNADIWPKMPVFGQIWPFLGPKSNFLGAGSKNFGTLISGFQ